MPLCLHQCRLFLCRRIILQTLQQQTNAAAATNTLAYLAGASIVKKGVFKTFALVFIFESFEFAFIGFLIFLILANVCSTQLVIHIQTLAKRTKPVPSFQL
jgi:hypothetical protein